MKHGCPRRQQSRNMAKISKSYILTPPHPQGHMMSVKCEQPIHELTVQVWLLYHNPNFKYCTLFVSGTGRDGITDGQTDKRTNRQTDDPNTRCPRRTFQAGGIKMYMYSSIWIECFIQIFDFVNFWMAMHTWRCLAHLFADKINILNLKTMSQI